MPGKRGKVTVGRQLHEQAATVDGKVERVEAAAAVIAGPETAARLGVPVGTRVDPYTGRPLDEGETVTVAVWERPHGLRAAVAWLRARFGG